MSGRHSAGNSQPLFLKRKRKRRIATIVAVAILAFLAVFFVQVKDAGHSTGSEGEDANGALVIAIDPGHSKGSEGAYENGISEQKTNWIIANAVVDELNTYSNVKAVLTRSYDQDMTFEERAISASEQGASVVVSIHCDSSRDNTLRGCLAIVPNSSEYLYDECHVEGARLASCILDELVATGVESRGIITRDSDIEDYYPNLGGISDYYGMNYYPRIYGMPGIIIEHGMLSNYDEAAMLASTEWCTKLGIADATGIAQYYGLK